GENAAVLPKHFDIVLCRLDQIRAEIDTQQTQHAGCRRRATAMHSQYQDGFGSILSRHTETSLLWPSSRTDGSTLKSMIPVPTRPFSGMTRNMSASINRSRNVSPS